MSPDTVVTKPISLEPSRPALPFAEISTELRFAVLKCVFPRGSVVANSFIVTADELALCVMHNGWHHPLCTAGRCHRSDD